MCLHGFLNFFKRSINIFPEFPAITYQKQRPRKFSDKEIDQVFEFLKEEDRGYFLFIRYYGVRPEEASGLLKTALNWEVREITISTVYVDGKVKPRTKTMKERNLIIIPEIEPYLRGHRYGATGKGTVGLQRGYQHRRKSRSIYRRHDPRASPAHQSLSSMSTAIPTART
jgi:hypothetical protein